MDYAHYGNAVPQPSWNTETMVPMMQQQAQPIQQPSQQTIPQAPLKQDPQAQLTPQAPPIVYGTQASQQPLTSYEMPVNWVPQMVPQPIIQMPHQWPTTSAAPVGHQVSIDADGTSIPNSCIHTPADPQQSHYTQYPTMTSEPTYWNTDLVDNQPTTLEIPTQTTSTLATGLPEMANSAVLIDNRFIPPTIEQPNVTTAMPPAGQADVIIAPHQLPQPPPLPTNQFDEQLAIGTSCHIDQMPATITDGAGTIEDALEVIKSQGETFSGPRQTCSSTSGEEDDDHSRGPPTGEREKERRQANNARERLVSFSILIIIYIEFHIRRYTHLRIS